MIHRIILKKLKVIPCDLTFLTRASFWCLKYSHDMDEWIEWHSVCTKKGCAYMIPKVALLTGPFIHEKSTPIFLTISKNERFTLLCSTEGAGYYQENVSNFSISVLPLFWA